MRYAAKSNESGLAGRVHRTSFVAVSVGRGQSNMSATRCKSMHCITVPSGEAVRGASDLAESVTYADRDI